MRTAAWVKSAIAPALLLTSSLYIILENIYYCMNNYIVPLYWDQWEFAKFVSGDPMAAAYLSEIFRAHNEHIIAPTRALAFIDAHLFSFTNLPLIVAFPCLASLTAFLLSKLVTYQRPGLGSGIVFIVLTSAGLSLVQWENLLWGFQSQFEIVLIGALFSIFCALRLTDGDGERIFLMIPLCLGIGFTVFSMGSGVAIPVPVLFVLIMRRARPSIFALTGLASASFAAAFFYLTRHRASIGDLSLRTPPNLFRFFLTMIGNPLSPDEQTAMLSGLVLFVLLTTMFIAFLTAVGRFGRKPDPGLIGLFAFVAFLFATAAAAAWGRASLGISAAMPSRYATPMLILWMTLTLVPLRFLMTLPLSRDVARSGLHIGLFAALALVAWTDFRPELASVIGDFIRPIRTASYFVASGVTDDGALATLYPAPELIRRPLQFIRDNRMNMFADRFGLKRPDKKDLEAATAPSAKCENAKIDAVSPLGKESWRIDGWAMDKRHEAPSWVFSLGPKGQVAGFTPPLYPRNDVATAAGAAPGFKGFALPIYLPGRQRVVSVVAVFRDRHSCHVDNVGPLPIKGPDPVSAPDLVPVNVKAVEKGAVGHPGFPATGLFELHPYAAAQTMGTWMQSDGDTGDIALEVPDPQCRGFYLPLVRGPGHGTTVSIVHPEGRSEAIALGTLTPHKWAFFRIEPSKTCVASPDRTMKIELKDRGTGLGDWAALGMPGIPK